MSAPLKAAAEAGESEGATVGRPIVEVVDEYRSKGLPLAYSSALLPREYVVLDAPTSQDPIAVVKEILQPYQLTLLEVEGLHVVTRLAAERSVSDRAASVPVATVDEDVLAEVVVLASRYEFLRKASNSKTNISQHAIQALPNFGQDPVRAVQRLPGTASGGVSAMPHIRGADSGETGIVVNGEQLLDPFHFRDYQSIFSIIDARAIDGLEVFTGGFPAQYGDRIGGLLLIDTIVPDEKRISEIGLSIFNTSLMSAGTFANGDTQWLVSARRSNLDLVLGREFGRPLYADLFTVLTFNISPHTKISVNGLFAKNRARVVADKDIPGRERSSNKSRSAQTWINWSQDWTDNLSSVTGISTSANKSTRVGLIDDPGKMIGQVADFRDFDVFGMRQDWSLQTAENHRWSWGADYKRLQGAYDYSGAAEYFGPLLSFDGISPSFTRDSDVSIDGESYALYLSDQWRLTPKTVVDLGLRWDKQTYTGLENDAQFSPRFSLVHQLGPNTDLRLSWGRYYQSQGINELQVEDGVERFFRAQRSDTAIVGLQHRVGDQYVVRVEAYRKSLQQQRPRFENILDPLAVIPELEPGRVRIEADKGFSQGIETSVVYDNDGKLGWWASYSLAKTSDRIAGRNVAKSWDQRHAVQIGLDWTSGRWEFGMAANLRSGWPTTRLGIDPAADSGTAAAEFGPRNAQRFPNFATLDVKAAYTVPLRNGSLNFFLEVSNVTDRKNQCCIDVNVVEDIAGNLVLNQKNDNWLPLFPSIGILWQF
ncbi:MAG: TonB-dependent receptor [Gammaproteobacteria bacterium]|nr:TonB-dependent receptor [Gammaproteobacteria bacterium]